MTTNLFHKHKITPPITNNILFVIPSWSEVLGYPTLGKYANHDITKILTDIIIFFGGTELSIITDKGTLYCIFGLGYYYTKFELKSGRYIIDSRQLNGLLLSDFVYDYIATSPNITLENDQDVVYTDKVVKVPIDLSFKSNTALTFIKGALMRNLFIPYKDSFLEMMNTIKKNDSYNINEDGYMLLSTHWDCYNKILISSKMNYAKYINPTAGINEITTGADDFIKASFSNSKIMDIEKNISQLKDVYSIIEYDPMYLFSIIENASKYLRNPEIRLKEQKQLNRQKTQKQSILISAEKKINTLTQWPSTFRRKTKEELEFSIPVINHHLNEGNNVSTNNLNSYQSDLYNNEGYNTPKNEDFVLKTMRSNFVKSKPLPQIPTTSIKDILLYLKSIIKEDYDMPSIGIALELARDNLRKHALHLNYMWEMSKLANFYKRQNPNLSLSKKDKFLLIEKVDDWINNAHKNMIRLNP